MRLPSHRIWLASSLLAGGCSISPIDTPSLGPRAIEARADEPARAVPPRESRGDPALAARIEALVADAERGDAAFRAMIDETRAAVVRARGSGAESEAWIRAQLALSALEGERAAVVGAMGELDAILAGQAQSGEPAEVETLEAGRARVEALLASEAEAYSALAGALNPL